MVRSNGGALFDNFLVDLISVAILKVLVRKFLALCALFPAGN